MIVVTLINNYGGKPQYMSGKLYKISTKKSN